MSARLVIAGSGSHAGKTTVAMALCAAYAAQGLSVAPFKAGPDFIDPGYATWASGRPARNLDTWLVGEDGCRELFARGAAGSDLALVEGVMGLYDGRGGEPGAPGSTAHLARILDAPVLCVLDIAGMAVTAAAIALGLCRLWRDLVAGFILNRAGSPGHAQMVRQAVEAATGLPVLGALTRRDELAIAERPLGLQPARDLRPGSDFRQGLVAAARAELDLPGILAVARAARPLAPARPRIFAGEVAPRLRRFAIAQDAAFQFYYPDSLDLLAFRGIEWVPFSPLAEGLPPDVDGVFFGGGFPERHLQALSENTPLWEDLRGRRDRLAIYAECGGLMVLCRDIGLEGGGRYPMAGVLPAHVTVGPRRTALGYREGGVLRDALFLRSGDAVRGHEFHYSRAEGLPEASAAYRLTDSRGRVSTDGYAGPGLLASYLHLHFAAHPELARRWAQPTRSGDEASRSGCP